MSSQFAATCKPVDHYDESAPIRVWVGNLGLYNEGYLVGEWLSLPADDDELSACFERIGVAEGSNVDELGTVYEETILNDYETSIPGLQLDEFGDLDEYNEIARWYSELDDSQKAIAAARLENGATYDELANDRYFDDAGVYQERDIQSAICELVEELGGVSELGRETLERYFDWEAFARDVQLEGDWHEVEIDGTCYQVELR